MEYQNPYAAPRVELIQAVAPPDLPDWSIAQLRVLGWLSLVSLVVGLASTGIAALGSEFGYETLADWLNLASGLLGAYLLLNLKRFLEERFAAQRLAAPIWLSVVLFLLMGAWEFAMEDGGLESLGWQSLGYFGALVLAGVVSAWLGVRLLKIPNPYPSLRVLGWLYVVGGVMMASLILMLLALLPLLASDVAMALVFFRGASELRRRRT